MANGPHIVDDDREDDDDDPVIHEIPVYLSKSLQDRLYLFQYPVRPATMPYDSSSIFSSRIKPRQGKIELSLEIDTESGNFDSSKAEQIALNVDGSDHVSKTSELHFPNGTMDRQTLTSTLKINDASRYCVGILDSNELHITSIKDVATLRPNLTYLDKGDKTAKSEGRFLDETLGDRTDWDDNGLDEDGEEEMKPITVKFAKTDAETAKKIREKSYDYQQNKANEESWIPMRYNRMKSEEWVQESQNMFCKRTEDESSSSILTPAEYLDSLKPKK